MRTAGRGEAGRAGGAAGYRAGTAPGTAAHESERRVIGTLTTLRTVQAQFQQAHIVDQDGDGIGEYGLLQELSGAAVPRGGPRGDL